jgi:hypothetical protein
MNLSFSLRHDLSWFLRRTLVACLLGAQFVGAQGIVRESDVEAAYLFNFGKFMRAPSHPGPNFQICILGTNPFGSTLDQLTAQESIDDRPMHIVRMTSPEGVRSCDILFLGETDPSRVAHDLELLGDASVLTVSTMSGFLSHGGMIQFVVQQNRVRFQVNLDAVTRTHIQLSSELLKVALTVTGTHAAGRDNQ